MTRRHRILALAATLATLAAACGTAAPAPRTGTPAPTPGPSQDAAPAPTAPGAGHPPAAPGPGAAGQGATSAPGEATQPAVPSAPLRRAPTQQPLVALTFDVTWGQAELQEVLAALAQAGARATFFVSHHWAANHPELLQQLAAAGHEVGTLGVKLQDPTRLPPGELQQSLGHAQSLIQRTLAAPARLYRPFDGHWNPAVLAAAAANRLLAVTWSVDGGDGTISPPPPAAIARRVLGAVQPGDIVRLHASDFSRNTGEALPLILAGLRERGFQAVTVSQLVAP